MSCAKTSNTHTRTHAHVCVLGSWWTFCTPSSCPCRKPELVVDTWQHLVFSPSFLHLFIFFHIWLENRACFTVAKFPLYLTCKQDSQANWDDLVQWNGLETILFPVCIFPQIERVRTNRGWWALTSSSFPVVPFVPWDLTFFPNPQAQGISFH